MKTTIVTMVMIENENGEVLVQKRKLKYPGLAFPGGHIETQESVRDCAIREVSEETGLIVTDLMLCGVIHWCHRVTDERYLCFMYKTKSFAGDLIVSSREGDHFWLAKDELSKIDHKEFSNPVYALSPLLHDTGKHYEAFIIWDETSNQYDVKYL